jgi:hypothetical protein
MCIAARLSLQIPVLNVSDVPSNFRIVSAIEGQMVDALKHLQYAICVRVRRNMNGFCG